MSVITLAVDARGFSVQIVTPSTAGAAGKVVLLVHGASAGSNTFKEPQGGLRAYLERDNWSVYSVDWRSSMLTVPSLVTSADHTGFTLDDSVLDLEIALAYVCKQEGIDARQVAVVGHCVGGGLVSQAVARYRSPAAGDASQFAPFLPERIVITTLALFWKVGVEGWFKGTDLVIDDVRSENQKLREAGGLEELTMSAGDSVWEQSIEDRFQLWLKSGLHHGCGISFCQRMAFMYGMPFRLDDVQYLHSDAGLRRQFGAMPLGIYVHCLQNLRRGWAAPYAAVDSDVLVAEAARQNFAHKRMTLITGNENQVWHRDGIDRMYEWLNNGKRLEGAQVVKHVLPKYGHQDLYWSELAPKDVYPKILAGITPSASGSAQ